LPENTNSAEIAVSTGYACTVEQFPDEIGSAFAAAKKLSVEINRPADPADEPTLIYVVANDDTATS
jgi:hypothetical protein